VNTVATILYNMRCLYSIAFVLLIKSLESAAFSPLPILSNVVQASSRTTTTTRIGTTSSTSTSTRTRIYSILDDKTSSENEFEGFNPFNRKETSTTQRAPQVLSSTISLRQLRMKDVMTTLLNTDETNFESILIENEELIMEPLLDDDAVMDEDSIYDVGMNREERFERIRKCHA